MNAIVDALKTEVYAFAQPEGRMSGTKGHRLAGTRLAARLTDLGLDSYRPGAFEIPYIDAEFPGTEFRNIVAVIPGRDRSLAPVLIGAHYDTVIPHPCADDNAVCAHAGPAIVLAASKAAATALRIPFFPFI